MFDVRRQLTKRYRQDAVPRLRNTLQQEFPVDHNKYSLVTMVNRKLVSDKIRQPETDGLVVNLNSISFTWMIFKQIVKKFHACSFALWGADEPRKNDSTKLFYCQQQSS